MTSRERVESLIRTGSADQHAGRICYGQGGPIILDHAKAVLDAEFPELGHLDVRLPDEKIRRVGQSIAAASLPAIARS